MSESVTKPLLVSVVGPTAIGKTKLAIDIANEFNTEIISADSRQFYKELEIGTAKPSGQELDKAPHHFINSHTIKQPYSAGEFGRDARQLLDQLFQTNKIVVAVGGSSLYLKSIWEGFDEIPEVEPSIREQLNIELQEEGLEKLLLELKQSDPDYYDQVDKNNGQRIIRALEVIRGTKKPFSPFRKSAVQDTPYRNLKIGLEMDRELLFDRINRRMDVMIKQGLFEEAEGLIAFKDHNALQTVGYSEIFDYLEGKYDKEEAVRLLKRNSRRYAKRQMTWFKRYDNIHWFQPNQLNEVLALIKQEIPR